MVKSLFADPEWLVAEEERALLERMSAIDAAQGRPQGPVSLIDFLESEWSEEGTLAEQIDRELLEYDDFGVPSQSFAAAAAIAEQMVRKPDSIGTRAAQLRKEKQERESGLSPCPQDSNTGAGNSHKRPTKDHRLEPASHYLPSNPPPSVPSETPHWSLTDPELFASLPQGGGGVDWVTVSIYGKLNAAGVALRDALKSAKGWMGSRDEAVGRCADAGLTIQTWKYREHMVFTHPRNPTQSLLLQAGSDGKGRAFMPLIVTTEGVRVCYGRLEDSGFNNERGPIARLQLTGAQFLRLGEAGAFELGHKVLKGLGIVVESMNSSRIDACADLPNMTVDTFVNSFMLRNFRKRGGKPKFTMNNDGTQFETFSISSKAVTMRIYDKLAECREKDPTCEREALMEQNRWGGPVESAVRVEFQFNMGKIKGKKFDTFADLLAGLSDLIGWATNSWFYMAEVGDDRTHNSHERHEMCDHWLRVLHAFAFWAGRLDARPSPPRVQSAPAWQLLRTAMGFFASALGRAGLLPSDDVGAFTLLAHWMGPDALAEACRKRAVEYMALRGVDVKGIELRSNENDRPFEQLRAIADRIKQEQREVEQVPF